MKEGLRMPQEANTSNYVGSNGDNGYTLPLRLLDPAFYTSRPMREHFIRLRWPVDMIDTTAAPRLNAFVAGGPFDRAGRREIYLPNRDGGIFAKFFVKIHHPARRIVLGPSGQPQEDLASRVEYEAKNLRYWNLIGLPSPYFFELLREDVAVRGEEKPQEAFSLLMSHVSAPTHDLDIFMIDDKIAQYRNRLEDPFLDPAQKGHLPHYIQQLENEKDRIIESILRTQIRCQLLGTYHLKDIGKTLSLDPKRAEDPVAKELRAISYYLRVHHFYELVRAGKISVDTARQGVLLPEEETSFKMKEAAFLSALTPLFQYLYADTSLLRYIHGDEYLHHYAYKYRREGEALYRDLQLRREVPIHSVMFDATDACMGLPEFGLAKILLSYLVDYPPDKVDHIVSRCMGKLLPEMANSYERGQRPRIGISSLVPSFSRNEFVDRSAIAGIATLLRGVGLKGSDELFNHEHFDKFSVLRREYPMGESLVKFPEDVAPRLDISEKTTVSYAPYSSGQAFPRLYNRLYNHVQSFLHRSRSVTNPCKSLEEHVRTIDKLCSQYHFYP
ncbi:hypothetical protein HYS50_02335 [Candidatus Woesearchaeota archaeon]|nr:hypothetical protein [Candidatus Woesearchaeota archaeon]